ncbi:MAG: shikimate dehydrogenase [Lachnospiraceae bacterium]|nr:shikimate dehydrogenase [Lachnospiraceae bacterium]
MEARITATTKLYGLIGTPIRHSGSPAMYNYSFERKGIDAAYLAFDVDREHTKDAIDAMKLFDMGGMNVTMPCKIEVVQYMDELSDAARIMGAVNTIVNDNGKLIGHNTDGVGFVLNLKDHGVEVKDKKITVCGGGGAATAVQVQCALEGVRELTIFNKKDQFFERTVQTAEKLKMERENLVVNVYDIDDVQKMTEEMNDSDIFVNGTVVGMKPMDDMSVVKDISTFRKDLVVCDVVYNPVETKMMREAKAAGCKVIGGKGMLLWQGVYAFKLYTGCDMPVDEVKERFFK